MTDIEWFLSTWCRGQFFCWTRISIIITARFVEVGYQLFTYALSPNIGRDSGYKSQKYYFSHKFLPIRLQSYGKICIFAKKLREYGKKQ
jgi:hypothetical protein